MLFHTWTFLIFFAVSYSLFRQIKTNKGKRLFIMACSFLFYGWWNPLYLLLISWVITSDFTSVNLMERTGRKRLFLSLSIINNLAVLSFFKYGNFFINNVNSIFNYAGIGYNLPQADILLPVGISFFIFQSMSYTIDYYYGRINREKNLIQYAAFVSFFPQLVAGPIERASHLLPQMRQWPTPTKEKISEGIFLFILGMFKKIALADYFAMYSDTIFGNPMQYSAGDLLAGILAFTWQIYFDFSGYTDMARGLAKMMGIEIMKNFKLPYMAVNMKDFWGRWHISLSLWFRDYVYIPLGGNKGGKLIVGKNILATMLLSGLWHGASWNFVLWGLIHAMLYQVNKIVSSTGITSRIPVFLKRIVVFIIIIFTWIFFRAENANDAFLIIRRLFTTKFTIPGIPLVMGSMMVICYIYEWLLEYKKISITERPVFRILSIALMLIYLIFFASYDIHEFIYFQF